MKPENLSLNAKKMLISTMFANITTVLGEIFLNAFIWRELNSIESVAVYNLGMMITLPIAFFFNGLLLRKLKLVYLYSFGIIGRVLVVMIVIFISGELNSLILFLLGLLYGTFNGFYWGNRNYLGMKFTTNSNRIYYSSLENVVSTVTSIIFPIVTGWFIVGLGESVIGVNNAYKILAVATALIGLVAGFIIASTDIKNPKLSNHFRMKKSENWINFRFVSFFEGVIGGAMFFLPILIVLNILGDEGILGTLSTIAAIVTAMILFVIGKKTKPEHRKIYLYLSYFFLILVSIVFSIFFDQASAIAYRLITSLAITFYWVMWMPVYYQIIDEQNGDDTSGDYFYILDAEIFINLGRGVGIVFIILLMSFLSANDALRILPVIFALTQIPAVYYIKKTFDKLKKV